MDCGTGSTEDSCGDCAPCGNGNGDCQPVPGTQPPQCIETGNCSKAKLFQVTKNISIASLMPIISLIDLICFVLLQTQVPSIEIAICGFDTMKIPQVLLATIHLWLSKKLQNILA